MTHGISPSIFDTLRRLGLTEYGARCYVALLSLKSAEASAVAEAAEVPRTKVYAALKDLADAGWVVAGGGRPVIYRPVAPDDRIHLAEKRLAEDAESASRELQARFAMGAQMIPVSIYMIRGRDAIDAKTLELVSRARESLFLNIGFALDDELSALADALRKAARRGVALQMMVAPSVDARALGDLAAEARVALFPFRGVICDWRQALITLRGGDGEPLGLWNPSQAFVEAIAPALRGAWEASPR